jgi:D-alanine-D-alanine ligase
VMPHEPGRAITGTDSRFRALPSVLRFNHDKGMAPYSGAVAVTRNSRALTINERQTPEICAVDDACVAAAELVNARAPIRIDCRADENGKLKLFDLNMKPNMTGAGRPGREDQELVSYSGSRHWVGLPGSSKGYGSECLAVS